MGWLVVAGRSNANLRPARWPALSCARQLQPTASARMESWTSGGTSSLRRSQCDGHGRRLRPRLPSSDHRTTVGHTHRPPSQSLPQQHSPASQRLLQHGDVGQEGAEATEPTSGLPMMPAATRRLGSVLSPGSSIRRVGEHGNPRAHRCQWMWMSAAAGSASAALAPHHPTLLWWASARANAACASCCAAHINNGTTKRQRARSQPQDRKQRGRLAALQRTSLYGLDTAVPQMLSRSTRSGPAIPPGPLAVRMNTASTSIMFCFTIGSRPLTQ